MKGDVNDPKALIREAYRIEGITESECRTIFLDWALGVPQDTDARDMVRALLVQYTDEPDDHPMTVTLKQALDSYDKPRRRGGRSSRVAT